MGNVETPHISDVTGTNCRMWRGGIHTRTSSSAPLRRWVCADELIRALPVVRPWRDFRSDLDLQRDLLGIFKDIPLPPHSRQVPHHLLEKIGMRDNVSRYSFYSQLIKSTKRIFARRFSRYERSPLLLVVMECI